MAAIAQPDVFQQAHQDAKLAVSTFLPSLVPQPPQVPPPPSPQVSPKIKEGVRAASIIRNTEMSARRAARGLPPQPPPPPSPQETFPPAIDQVHIRALAAAIASHPETQRPALLHEAHANVTKWISAHNGQIVVDGHVEIATSPESAERLAAKIINGAVDSHDERDQAKRAAVGGISSDKSGRNVQHDRGDDRTTANFESAVGLPPTTGAGIGDNERGDALPDGGNGPRGNPAIVPPVGSVDPEIGRPITQSSSDLDEAQEIATSAAPELKEKLGQVEDSVPGAEVDGVRDEKDPERAQQKVEADGKPVETQTDLLAGRIAVDNPEAKDAAVQQIKDSSPVIDEEDNFQDGDPDYGFRSHTIQVGLGDGKTSAEVQVVPKEIADVDDQTHDTYEDGREAEASGDDQAAQEAMATNKAAHDAAMDKFNARNADKPSRIVKSLEASGFKVRGAPVKIGGHLFVPVVDDDEK